VQDWNYWGNRGWGPHWDHTRYPHPAAMVADLSAAHVHFMVSVWSKFDNTTSFHRRLVGQCRLTLSNPR